MLATRSTHLLQKHSCLAFVYKSHQGCYFLKNARAQVPGGYVPWVHLVVFSTPSPLPAFITLSQFCLYPLSALLLVQNIKKNIMPSAFFSKLILTSSLFWLMILWINYLYARIGFLPSLLHIGGVLTPERLLNLSDLQFTYCFKRSKPTFMGLYKFLYFSIAKWLPKSSWVCVMVLEVKGSTGNVWDTQIGFLEIHSNSCLSESSVLSHMKIWGTWVFS